MIKRKSKKAKRKTPTSKKEINKQRQIIGIVLIAVLIVAGLFVAFIGGRATGAFSFQWFSPSTWFQKEEPISNCVDSDAESDNWLLEKGLIHEKPN